MAAAWRGGIVPAARESGESMKLGSELWHAIRNHVVCMQLKGSIFEAAAGWHTFSRQAGSGRTTKSACELGQYAGLHARDIAHEAREQPKHD